MSGTLASKTALVTGGARGIGRAAALAYAREGANVVITDLEIEGAEKTAAQIIADGGRAHAIQGDVCRAADVERMVRLAVDEYGGLDCAFNNAAITSEAVGAGFLEMDQWPEEAFDRLIEVNLKSVWLCMRAELKAMLANGRGGSIVNATSVGGVVGIPGGTAYGAAKHGIVGLTKVAAVEYAARGVRVNAVAPGMINTEMMRSRLETNAAEHEALIPAGRLGEVDDIAEMVVWLSSERANYVTGQVIAADGGYLAR